MALNILFNAGRENCGPATGAALANRPVFALTSAGAASGACRARAGAARPTASATPMCETTLEKSKSARTVLSRFDFSRAAASSMCDASAFVDTGS